MFKLKLLKTILGAVVCLALSPAIANATPVRMGFDSATLAANDDGSTGLVDIGFTIDFFGIQNSQLFVNNNGNVTFDQSLSSFTPFDLTSTNTQIIAPFFGDVDTRGTGSDLVTYGTGIVDGRSAFGVNWLDVGYFSSQVDLLNSFQLVLIDRSDTGANNFDFEFNFSQIQWETGGASGGTNGLGGNSARVGYSNGTGDADTFFELDGSAVNGAFLDAGPVATALILNSLGTDVVGRYLFQVRNGLVSIPPVTGEVPLPGAFIFMATGLVAAMRYKKNAS